MFSKIICGNIWGRFFESYGTNFSCKIDERRVQNACYKIDYVASGSDRKQFLEFIHAQKRTEIENHDVDKLANERRKIISEPKHFFCAAGSLFCKRPPFMIQPHVTALRNRIRHQTRN